MPITWGWDVTVKILKIQIPKKFAVIILKFELRVFSIEKWVQKM